MTLNGTIALISRYFTKFDRLEGRLRYSGWSSVQNILFQLYFLKLTHSAVARSLCDRSASVFSIT